MRACPKRMVMVAALVLALPSSGSAAAAATAHDWWDTFYQYRIPVMLEADRAGWISVPLTPASITSAVNRHEQLQFDPLWFSPNHVKVVALDAEGRPQQVLNSAGFYLVPDGPELIRNGSFAQAAGGRPADWTMESGPGRFGVRAAAAPADRSLEINTCGGRDSILSHAFDLELSAFYLLRYQARVDTIGGCPSVRLTGPQGTLDGRERIPTSHLPALWARKWTAYEQFMKIIHWRQGTIRISGPVTGTAQVDDVSLRKMRLVFAAELERSGRHLWHLYYQPVNGTNLTVPQRHLRQEPSEKARLLTVDGAQKYLGRTRYRVTSTDALDIWFAETTVKLSPQTAAPEAGADVVRIACAGNEKQSFQLVIRPRREFRLLGVEVTELRSGRDPLPPSRIEVRALEYVPIVQSSPWSGTSYSGSLADPMVALEPRTLTPTEGNVPLWITVDVPAGTRAGRYRGSIVVQGEERAAAEIPLELEVYDFQLPEISPFRSSMGGGHITKVTHAHQKTVADYHGVSSKAQIKMLARAYFDEMARHKFTPHSVVQYSEIGMNWSPPPAGYNVDAPDNHFQLDDWDFTEFNRDLRHYIDDLKVNAFTLVHTNPSVITMFKHLPGEERSEYHRRPPHVSLAWQSFRKATHVGYDKREHDQYTEISKAQFDHLVLSFYRKIAENLEQHGWLDYAYIMVDETAYRGYEVYLDFMRLLKSDPLTARFQFVWCLQGPAAFVYKTHPDDAEYAFNNLLDVYMPETNEKKHFWEKYHFTDYGIEARREKLWNYVTFTTRTSIDTPGIDNRAIAVEVFNNGGGGFLIWGTFIWDAERVACDNPWDDPGTYWGNGALAFFYPPSRYGPAREPDWTIVPSLRIQTFREGVDDFEYAKLLEERVAAAAARGRDVSEAEAVLDDIKRFFPGSVHWSQNDAWYLNLRDRLARAIVALN